MTPPEARNGPCPTHQPEQRSTWLWQAAPRYAASLAAGDPYADADVDDWPRAGRVPEFASVREQLSDDARHYFDCEWLRLTTLAEYPATWETFAYLRERALGDATALAAAVERDWLRQQFANHLGGEYPLGSAGGWSEAWEVFGGPKDAAELLQEADKLVEVAGDLCELIKLLRDHAAASRDREQPDA